MQQMNILQQILEILKYILPAIIVLIATVVIVNNFLIKETERKRLSIFQQTSDKSMQLRLQAYERLTIFIERMHPMNMIGRLYQKEATAQDLQLAMVQSIRAEFEHNVSQQIYVSHQLWQTINSVKEQEITMLNRIGSTIALGAPASDFVKAISEGVIQQQEDMPTSIALEYLNKEAKILLFENK
jgi:sorbitol-specific phosphotransferase system component IIC